MEWGGGGGGWGEGGSGCVRCLHEYHSGGTRSRIEGQNRPVKERNCHGVKGMSADRALVFFVDGVCVWHSTSELLTPKHKCGQSFGMHVGVDLCIDTEQLLHTETSDRG